MWPLLHIYQLPSQAWGPSFTILVTVVPHIFIDDPTAHHLPIPTQLIASMASRQVIVLLFFTLVLATDQAAASSSHILRGSVTCLDCDLIMHHNHLSEIKILVRCRNVKKIVMATTKADGTFETELPTDTIHETSPKYAPKCLAKIVGGSSLLYTLGKKTISGVVKVEGQDYYTNREPLNFYKSCPQLKYAECASAASFGSSKTVDVPLPREWGLAPSSYYFPFIPIIGIP